MACGGSDAGPPARSETPRRDVSDAPRVDPDAPGDQAAAPGEPGTPGAPAAVPIEPLPAVASCAEPEWPERDWTRAVTGAMRRAPADDVLTQLAGRCVSDAESLATRVNELGLAWHRRRRFDLSARLFRIAAERNPSSAAARFNLACALSRQGLLGEANAELIALRAYPTAARWLENATRDADLRALWDRPGGWRVLSTGVPPVLQRSQEFSPSLQAPVEVIPLTLPDTDAAQAWSEVELDRETVRTLTTALRRFRRGLRIGAPQVPAPISALFRPEEKVSPRHLSLVRRPAVWRPEPDVVFLVLPLVSNTALSTSRGAIAVLKQVEGGLALYHVVVNDVENHGVFEESDVVVARDYSFVGAGAAYDGSLFRQYYYVRDGELYSL